MVNKDWTLSDIAWTLIAYEQYSNGQWYAVAVPTLRQKCPHHNNEYSCFQCNFKFESK